MKNRSFILVSLFAFFAGWCQNSNFAMSVSQLKAETVYFPIQGSPFYDDTYRLGKVYFRGERYMLFFRFNALKDRIELKDRTKQLFHLQKEAILEPTFGGRTYKYIYYYEDDELKQGYMVPLVKGPVTLYYKPKKVDVSEPLPGGAAGSGQRALSPLYPPLVAAPCLQVGPGPHGRYGVRTAGMTLV
jgi:hypothetical protein